MLDEPAVEVMVEETIPGHDQLLRQTFTYADVLVSIGIGCLLLLLLCFGAVAFTWIKRGSPSRYNVNEVAAVCASEGCIRHARLIAAKVNVSMDPCEDFEAFACSRWTAATEHYDYASAVTSALAGHWFDDFRASMVAGAVQIPTGRRVIAALDSCTAESTSKGFAEGLKVLKAFMSRLRISWPEESFPKANPLGVLLDMAYNWRLGLWFEAASVHNSTNNGERRPLVFLSPGTFVIFWYPYQRSVSALNYEDYWNHFYRTIAPDQPQLTTEEITRIASVENGVFSELIAVSNSTIKEPAEVSLADMERFTNTVSPNQWIVELNKAIRPSDLLTTASTVVVSDVALLRTIDNLFSRYTRRELLRHISWFFIQVFAGLADRRLLVSKVGHEGRAWLYRHIFCATEVEAAFKALVVALYLVPRFAKPMRQEINDQLSEVVTSAIHQISNVSWADKLSKGAAVRKLQSIKTLLWLPDSLLTEDALSVMYSNFSLNESSFISYFLNAYENSGKLIKRDMYAEALSLPLNFVLPFVNYDYIRNAVSIAMAALSAPLYAANATAAMFYGGLGFSYAMAVVRALDDTGLRVDPQGRVLNSDDSWVSVRWKDAVAAKTSCLGVQSATLFPEIPAVEIAYAAFQSALAKKDRPKRLGTNFTEEQEFFITACFSLCRLPQTVFGSLAGSCNKAVMHSAAFSEAFGCKNGRNMNASRMCSYFD
ncbi:endothelin-converting enzyme 2-like [Dermacentor variabilis]|uniref:endothelin-converting enzyme 2-like n=1 Tax=Dermacentor variabilis TaxID=34621 RepID=UPI003F5C18C2